MFNCKHGEEIEILRRRVAELEANYSPGRFVDKLMGYLSDSDAFGLVTASFMRRMVETINEMQIKK